MKTRKIILLVCIAVAINSYLHWLVGLPYWISGLIAAVFLIPPIAFYTNMGLLLIFNYLSIGIHIYTVVFAFREIWWKGIVTLVLPGISQVYWFIIEATNIGIHQSVFCRIMLAYIFALALRFISPLLFKSSREQKKVQTAYVTQKSDIEPATVKEQPPVSGFEEEYRRLERLIMEAKLEEDEMRLRREMEALLPSINQPPELGFTFSYNEDGRTYYGGKGRFLPPRRITCRSCGRINHVRADTTEFRCKKCGARVFAPITLWDF